MESKKNKSGLVKAVKNIDENNKYIVVMDNSFDNPEVFRELSWVKKYVVGKNVVIVNLICFDYILLEFADLLLTDELRKYISLDGKNQYLLMGRNPRNLFATRDNIFELVSKKEEEKVIFKIEAF